MADAFDNRKSVIISAVKRLITINRIQNKSVCLHYICMCTVYNYLKTHILYILKIFLFIHLYIHILILYINI